MNQSYVQTLKNKQNYMAQTILGTIVPQFNKNTEYVYIIYHIVKSSRSDLNVNLHCKIT